MNQYKKKPVVWNCVQYDGSNAEEMTEFCYLCVYDEGQQKLIFNGMTVEATNWILEDASGVFTMLVDEQFIAAFSVYVTEEAVEDVYVGRYEPRPIVAVEAVTWNGGNFGEVQVVCPQASVEESVVSIPNFPEVYVGEVVVRDLGSGEFSKMEAGIFKVLYGSQLL